jgi:hypothetical protein
VEGAEHAEQQLLESLGHDDGCFSSFDDDSIVAQQCRIAVAVKQ